MNVSLMFALFFSSGAASFRDEMQREVFPLLNFEVSMISAPPTPVRSTLAGR